MCQGCNSIDILEFKALVMAPVKAGVNDKFRKALDWEMVKAQVKVGVKAIQKCLLNCNPAAFSALTASFTNT